MKQAEQFTLYMPTYSADSLTDEDFGELRLVFTPNDSVRKATLFDTFDHSLRLSGRLLLSTGRGLEVIGRDGSLLQQPARQTTGLVAALDDGVVKDALADVSPLRALMPVGDISLGLVMAALVDDEAKTHIRVHVIEVLTEAGFSGLLVSLRCLRGYEESLDAALDCFCALGGKPLKTIDLYAKLFPKHSSYDPKPCISIGNDEAAFDVATDIIASYLPVARANEEGIVADIDTEFLHDYRIALRKIRSVLSLFKGVYDDKTTSELKTRFSALMAPTGQQRDLDVYLLEKQKFYDLLPDSLHGGLDKMFALFAEERQKEQKTLAAHLSSEAYRQEVKELGKLVPQVQETRARSECGPSCP